MPTGLETAGPAILVAEAGPVPHLPANGKVVSFVPGLAPVVTIASGAPLAVNVEFGPAARLYVLSQGFFPPGNPEGSPAAPGTGSLFRVNLGGTVTSVASGLNQPTSVEFFGDDAYIVTIPGEIWTVNVD